MNVQILDRAEADLSEGYSFYEEQKNGLGMDFLRSVLTDIRKLKLRQ